jgi:hypothetical protein
MAIDYQALLRRPQIQAALGSEQLAEAVEDEHFLPELISGGEISVLSLSWDTGHVGTGAGLHWIGELNGLFFFFSSDLDKEGPFESLEEALFLETFHFPMPMPELQSDSMPLQRLIEIGRDLVSEDGDTIWINDKCFVSFGRRFLEAEDVEDLLVDFTIIGTYELAKGIVDFQEWSKTVRTIPSSEVLHPFLEIVHNNSKKTLKMVEDYYDLDRLELGERAGGAWFEGLEDEIHEHFYKDFFADRASPIATGGH